MHGMHLTADLRGCPPRAALMTSPEALREHCLAAVLAAGLTPVAELFHRFSPAPGSAEPPGITGVVLLAESHLAIHTWPELGAATLDVYVCNLGQDNSARAEALMQSLCDGLAAEQIVHRHLWRGAD